MAFRSKSVYEDSVPLTRKWLPEAEYRAQLAREKELFQARKQQEKESVGFLKGKYQSEHSGLTTKGRRGDMIDLYMKMSNDSTVRQIVENFDAEDKGFIMPFVVQTLRDMAGALVDHQEFQTKLLWIRQATGSTVAQILKHIGESRWPLVYKWLLAGPPYNGLRYAVNALWRKHGAGGFTPAPRRVSTPAPQMSSRRDLQAFWQAVEEQQAHRARWAEAPEEDD